MKLAIVHDYLNQFGGAERVVAVLHEIFPQAPIFTSFYIPGRTYPCFGDAEIHTSFIQGLPVVHQWYRAYFCAFPLAFERFDLSEYDVVLSSSSGWAHGVRTREDAVHICYCYTPPRWLWDRERYFERESFGRWVNAALYPVTGYLRRRDRRLSERPSRYVAISEAVAARILRCYGREAMVIYPPVEVEKFPLQIGPSDFYLVVSRLNAYKRLDVAIEAFNELGLPLRIVGDGPRRASLQERAKPNICFLGSLPDRRLIEEYVNCRALVFPGEEDFGLAPLEANACGRPVIAFAGGGALETVIEGKTGIFFRRPQKDDLVEAIARSEKIPFDAQILREHAEKFGSAVFRKKITELVELCCEEQRSGNRNGRRFNQSPRR